VYLSDYEPASRPIGVPFPVAVVILLFVTASGLTDSPHKNSRHLPYEDQSVTLGNTQNVSVTKIVGSSSIQCTETKYGRRIQLLALVVMIHEVWLNA